MNNGKVGVGVIGLGLISPPHIRGFQTCDDAELLVLCDRDAKKAEAAEVEHGVPAVVDYKAVLSDPRIDAVALLLPHQLHFKIAKEALEAGKHVLLEKPFVAHENEAEELIRIASERGLTLALAENTRFVRAYLTAEKMVKAGDLGDIRLVRGYIPDQILDEWADEPDGWKRQPAGAGVIMDCAPHMLYLLVWMFGAVKSLQAIALPFVPGVDLENHGIIAGRLASGALFSVEFSSVTEYPRCERVEIYGSAGTLLIDQVLDPPMVFYRGDKDSKGTPVSEIAYDLAGWKARSIGDGDRDFAAAVKAGEPPAVTLEEARATVRLLESAYKSVAQGGVRIDL